MSLHISELIPGFAAEVGGVDLTRPMDDTEISKIREAIDRHGVLVFHDQPLDDEKQIAFSRRLGTLETTISASKASHIPPEIAAISNVDKHGNQLPPDAWAVVFNRGNQEWHTDSSFKPVPANFSLLSAREIPPEGGGTEYADTRQGYDTWGGTADGITKEDLEGLVCEHSLVYSRGQNTGDIMNQKQKDELPPVRQALVRTNPATGHKGFFVGAHASHIIGWPVEKGRPLLRELTAWCTQERFTYCHTWRQHDLVMWDNRFMLHRGRPYNESDHRRVMHRTTVAGDGPTAPSA